jgi:hypothetical protein
MKKLLLTFLLLFSSWAVSAQTQHEYEQTMALFMRYYNEADTPRIRRLFRPAYRQHIGGPMRSNLETFGKIVAQEFVGIDTVAGYEVPVRVFKITYSIAGNKPMSFSLYKNPAADGADELPYNFGTFSFYNAAPRIEQMIDQAK